jgi:3'5'-cyclic nucleotide phosphodiesterase
MAMLTVYVSHFLNLVLAFASNNVGVSNAQLMKEAEHLSSTYRHRSVAEQNSLDITWNLLMEDRFQHLRQCMFSSNEDLQRFRQILVNLVLATDIFDKELAELRMKRWEKAFASDCRKSISIQELQDLQATVVIEHLIQASDVSHTMQHWHIYRKWNTHLFYEMYDAYRNGRMATDPSTFWYDGELKFFDNYIIPLTNKLKECQVFGVSSDEYLSYALQNRAEWAARGKEIIQEMLLDVA